MKSWIKTQKISKKRPMLNKSGANCIGEEEYEEYIDFLFFKAESKKDQNLLNTITPSDDGETILVISMKEVVKRLIGI